MPRPVVGKDPWERLINHRTPTAPKGQNEIAQGKAKRRPGYVAYGLTRREVPPFQGLEGFGPIEPRALPWAITLRPVGAKDH